MPALDNSLVALEEVVLEPAESPVPDGVFERLKHSARGLLGGSTLKAKVFRGGVWMGAGSFSEQVARFGRNMILTRLLAPEAFGTMAVVLSAGSLIQIVTEIGVKEAIIQNPRGTEDRYLSAAWWLAFLRSISIYAVVFLLAPWLSKFYGNHELVPLLRVVACGVIFEGTLSSKAYAAIKDMSFRKWALIHHGGGIAGVLITLVLSLFIRDVWALVLGNLAESGMRCVLSYVYCPYLPLLSWDKEAARELLHFSRRLFGLSFLNLIFSRADVFVLAKLYSPAALGLYVMGIYLVQTPTGFLMNLLGQTLLPTFSKVQGEKARENRILLQVTALLVQLGLPTMVFVFFCGRSLLTVFYGQRYATAALPLMIAACVAFVNLLNGQITVVFYGRGEPQLHRRSVAIMAIFMVVSIYPFAKWFGLAGGQIACLLAVVTGFLFQLLRMRKLTDLSLADFAKPFVYGGALALIVVAVALLSHLLPPLEKPGVNILLGILGCATAYALCATNFLRKRGKIAL
jgi:O-antigen/teichoic acid export membrane protein